jgi:exodeoxyribonuclease V beta subunit
MVNCRKSDSDNKKNGMAAVKITCCNEINLDSHAVVEASAGTGKTYTITGLVIRLVLGVDRPLKDFADEPRADDMLECWNLKDSVHPLRINQILLSTYTEAATEEMKHRVAESLKKSCDSFKLLDSLLTILSQSDNELGLGCLLEKLQKQSQSFGIEKYVFQLAASLMISSLKQKQPVETASIVLQDHVRIMRQELQDGQMRLSDAVRNIDSAQIVTIHQFCLIMLHRYAFESGSLFYTVLQADSKEAREFGEVREKRNFLYGDGLRSLGDYYLFSTLNAKNNDNISALIEAARRIDIRDRDAVLNFSGKPSFLSRSEFEQNIGKLQEMYDSLPGDFQSCRGDKTYITSDIVSSMKAVADKISESNVPDDKYLGAVIKSKTQKALSIDNFKKNDNKDTAFKYFEKTGLKNWADVFRENFPGDSIQKINDYTVLWQLKYAERLDARASEFMELRHRLTFNDLISNLSHALNESGERSERLTDSIRRAYPVAILDEFQDTSPQQYSIFKRIYLDSSKKADTPAGRLVILGDPKQAIFSFQNADVYSYLDARGKIISDDAHREGVPSIASSLTTNYRSNSDIVRFVNALFSVPKIMKSASDDGKSSVGCPNGNQASQTGGSACGSVFDHRLGIHPDGIGFEQSELPGQSAGEPVPQKCFFVHRANKNTDNAAGCLRLYQSSQSHSSPLEWQKFGGLVYTKAYDPAKFAAKSARYLLDNCRKAVRTDNADNSQNCLRSDEGCLYSLEKILPSDIAVLVKKKKQAAEVKKELQSLGVQSVFLSDRTSVCDCRLEFYFMEVLLHALACPADQTAVRRLATCPVITRSFDEMENCIQSSAENSDFLMMINKCADIWKKRSFLAAFYHFVSSPQIMLMHRLKIRSDGGRLLTNIMHLAEYVQNMAARKSSIYAVYSWFSELRFKSGKDMQAASEKDDEKIRLEAQKDVVRIVTIFSSKGLEYPVVINPYLSSNDSKSESYHKRTSYLWHVNDEKSGCMKQVLGLRYDKSVPNGSVNEKDDEKIRLLYVALTRAKFVNMLLVTENKNGGKQIDGFMKILLERRFGIKETNNKKNNKNNNKNNNNDNYKLWEKLLEEDCSFDRFEFVPDRYENNEYSGIISSGSVSETMPELKSAEFRGYIDRSWRVASYSSLCHARGGGSVNNLEAVVMKDDEPGQESEEQSVSQIQGFRLDRFHFPRGKAPGTFIHRLLEVVPFPENDNPLLNNKIKSAIEKEVSSSYFAKSSVFEKWHTPEGLECIVKWFHQITTTPLQFGDKTFSLSDIPNAKRLPEISFTFNIGSLNLEILDIYLKKLIGTNNKSWLNIPGDASSSQYVTGFLTGVIDLFFEYEDKYYILDYKSNFISFSADDYNYKNMENVIIQNRYDLQFLIYTLAAWRFLKTRIKKFDFKNNFGGVLYLFVRGLEDNCKNRPTGTGAYYFDIAGFGNEFINCVDKIFLYRRGNADLSAGEILEEIIREVMQHEL